MSAFPAGWVDRVFSKLSLTYGRDFTGRWEGLEVRDVKEDWRQELDGYERHPAAIAYALEHLPDKPPTVLEFRNLCNRAPEASQLRIDAPAADRARIDAEIAKMRAILAAPKDDPRAWARRIVARRVAGEHVDRAPLAMAREALRNEP